MAGSAILVIDSDEKSRTRICRTLSLVGFEVVPASSGTRAIQLIPEQPIGLVICDSAIVEEDPFSSAWDAFGILNWMKHMLPDRHIPLILHAPDVTAALQERAQASGIFAVVQKDRQIDLIAVVHQALNNASAE